MTKLSIPHNAWVLISDGQKALFLRNAGDERFPNLTTERVLVEENPPTHEQGTDRPGRSLKRAGTHSRSSVETTDWHELEKHRFAQRAAAAMQELMLAHSVAVLVVAAPPRTLAELRHVFMDGAKIAPSRWHEERLALEFGERNRCHTNLACSLSS
jgi:protein required for attachment to host cells